MLVNGILITGSYLLLTGCLSQGFTSSAPLEKIEHKWREGESQNKLLVYITGRRDRAEEFDSEGGLENWISAKSNPTEFPFDSLWHWLKDYHQFAHSRPETYLGYGTGDSLARSNFYLASVLPIDRVIKVAGGHNWKVWLDIWGEMLNTQTNIRSTRSKG